MNPRRPVLLSAVVLAVVIPTARSTATNRRFTYVYEATTMPVGEVEYEQWITWKTDKDIDSRFDRVDIRHEIEFALTDDLQLALYLSDWRYQDGRSVSDNGAEWRNAAVEVIWGLVDPVTEPLGVALYGEVKWGDELFVLESKLLLQKNYGKWIAAWNGTFEAEWEGSSLDEDKGELEQSLGLSYQLEPSLTVGVELLHEIEYDDWSEWGDHVVYAGPNISYRNVNWWITVTPLVQLTDVESEPNFQTRVLFGFDF
ncbi:MAG: DUF6662 family protein [Planctomycetota bacterium]|jgi:hypothetical protein